MAYICVVTVLININYYAVNRILSAALLLISTFIFNEAKACDTSPVLTASNVSNIGGGFYTFDLQVCLGTGGSQDGFNLTMGCGLNITATNQPTLNNAGKVASAGIAGGVLTYTYPGFPGTWWEVNDGIAGPCFNMTLTVNGNPEGCTVTSTGINDGCLIISTSWSTTVPGPCLVDFVMNGAGSQAGTTVGGGNNCTLRASQDIVVQVNIPCADTWTFSLCGGSSWDTYLYLGTSCCSASVGQNDDGCGLQSTITSALAPGTYYVTIEAFGSGTTGTFTLNVTSALPCSVLPVTLLSFDGIHLENERKNHLTWLTASEQNSDYFLLERSFDAQNFEFVSEVNAAGSSNQNIHYEWLDPVSTEGVTYYRLTQYDFDGSSSLSHIVAVEAESELNSVHAKVYPNPGSGLFYLELSGESSKEIGAIQVFNELGAVVRTIDHPLFLNGMTDLDLQSLEKGIYTIRLIVDDHTIIRKVSLMH